MSKCRPAVDVHARAITDFLRSVHVNGKPLDLPENIDQVHTNPRNDLNLVRTLDTEDLVQDARTFAVTEELTDRIEQLDQRLDSILQRLGR